MLATCEFISFLSLLLYVLNNFHNKLTVSQNLKLLCYKFQHSIWVLQVGNIHHLRKQKIQICPHLVSCLKGGLTILNDVGKSHKPNMEQNKLYTRPYTLWFHLYKLQSSKINPWDQNSNSQEAVYCTCRLNLWYLFELYTNDLCISLYICYISIKR